MSTTAGIKFLYQFSIGQLDNVNPGSNIVSVTSTAAGDHDKLNLTTLPLRETWRSTDTSAQEIVIRASNTTTIPNVFALLNHNLSSDAVVLLYGNNSNSWSSPSFSTPLIWNKKHMGHFADIGTAFQYYKIRILDAGNPCGYIEIGKIVGGLALTVTNNEDIADDFSATTEDMAYQMKTEGFFRAFNERVKIQTLTMQLPKLQSRSPDNANYLDLLTMNDFVGTTLPFLTILDPGEPYFKLHWGAFTKVPSESYTINRFVTFAMEIQEVF